jgi:uncharacterized repeat protein (TIGR01451 family)
MRKIVSGIALALVLLATAAGAQQKSGSIELKSTAEVEVVAKKAQGEKTSQRMDASKAKVIPGDAVIFITRYTNTDSKPAERVVLTNPVPEHVAYVDRSAEGKGSKIDFSVDGGKKFSAMDKLTKTDAAGKIKPASAGDITHIRWTLSKPLAPGGQGSVSFRGRVK